MTATLQSLLTRIESLERKVRSGLPQGRPMAQSVPIYGSTSEPGAKAPVEKSGVSQNVRELSDGAKLYPDWSRVMEGLQQTNPAAYSVLADTRAFVNGKYLLIEVGSFGREMLRNDQVKNSIRNLVSQISGIDCRLGPYTPSGAVQYTSNENNSSGDSPASFAEKIMKRAQEAGIDVEEE